MTTLPNKPNKDTLVALQRQFIEMVMRGDTDSVLNQFTSRCTEQLRRMGMKEPNWNQLYNQAMNQPKINLMPEWNDSNGIQPIYSVYGGPNTTAAPSVAEREYRAKIVLAAAQDSIKELNEVLEKIQKEALILYQIDRMSKDKKHAYVRKGDIELRIESVKDLEQGDEVLLHPKTMQIVERIGKPPLEVSRFAPDKIPDVKWEDIGGLESAKADMREAIEFPHHHKELFKHYSIPGIKGILLAGPPGCGKTLLGKAAATSLQVLHGKESAKTSFLYVKGPEILNQYVGQSEQTIRDLFWDARRHKEEHGYPAVIFLDEADAILAARGTRNIGIGNTIVPMFLTEMDGLEESGAIVIIATNRPDVLDPAIIRDGRVDRRILVTRPGMMEAAVILTLNLNKVPLQKGLKAEELAEDITGQIWSADCQVQKGLLLRDIVNGAMLANCVKLAVSSAMHRDIASGKKPSGVGLEDLQAAIHRLQMQSAGILHNLERDI